MTIYEALKAKLGREPSHDELTADVRRILHSVTVDLAKVRRRRRQTG